jgi:hypothetical protein
MPNNSVIPTRDDQFIAWINLHDQLWGDSQARIGLDLTLYNSYKSATGDLNTAAVAWDKAKLALKAASANYRDAKKNARTLGSAGVKQIRTFAALQTDPTTIYELAGLPAPKSPNFGVPPGTPTSANVTLDVNTGNLEVRFECNNPPGLSGTVYLVQRRTASASAPTVFSAWTQAAVTSVKRFIDSTITSGTASVQYIITAQRGTIQGRPSTPITVQFGRAGNGPGMTVTVGEDGLVTPVGKPKLAA